MKESSRVDYGNKMVRVYCAIRIGIVDEKTFNFDLFLYD